MPSVNDVVEPVLSCRGVELEELRQLKAGSRVVVRLTVDGDGASGRGLNLDEVAAVSQAVSAALDASDVMGDTPYVLEVGTRGVDRPLTKPAQWRRNRGRLIAVTLKTGELVTGRIADSDEVGVEVAPDRRIAFTDVAKAQVQVEMNRGDDDFDKEGEEPWTLT
ncbi:MAG: ribosome maturation factor RimP [Propionibacteriaceae bacterium]|jgi:ribosome maturation factor RimP|nr:ribosome maturation factor RimP [Propionibacteriaceae bacterium]